MAKCHFGVLFTPVTQCHVGRPMRSPSLFSEISYSLRLGGLCPDQSSIIDLETDLRHRALTLGDGRGSRGGPQTHLLGACLVFGHWYPKPDVGDLYRTSQQREKVGHRSFERCRRPRKVGLRVTIS